MFKKITIFTAILFTLLMSVPAKAATDVSKDIAELNIYCWHRIDCHNFRKQFLTDNPSDAELEKGFVSDISTAPCNTGTGDEQWGRCLPGGVTKTEISFGGQDRFSNIGEFIILMYKYLLTVASIVAVVMIIIAGMQWVTSGGNSEAISSAKKRISGAIIGLFIAYMSYFILNTINPAMVNLRLPQVWLTRPIALFQPPAATLVTMDKLEEAMVAVEAAMVSVAEAVPKISAESSSTVDAATAQIIKDAMMRVVEDAHAKLKEATTWLAYIVYQLPIWQAKQPGFTPEMAKDERIARRAGLLKDVGVKIQRGLDAVKVAAASGKTEDVETAKTAVQAARADMEAMKTKAVTEGWATVFNESN